MATKHTLSSLSAACFLALSAPISAADFNITVTNLTNGSYFTPLIVAAHTDAADIFEVGTAASNELELMAECGDTSGLNALLAAASADIIDNPAGGALAPGASTTFTLSTNANNTLLSLGAMILPTNDGFVGLDAVELPTAGGVTYYLAGYDAGTEINDEVQSAGCATDQAGFPAGPVPNLGTGAYGVPVGSVGADADIGGADGTIHIHRNVLGDTYATGGYSDIDSTAHRWLNPVARVTITLQ